VYHHFLKTRSVLWISPELSRALLQIVQVTTRLAAPQLAGDLLPCILADLENYYEDLDFLDDGEEEAEAWGPLGIRALPTRHVLGQVLEQWKSLMGEQPSPRHPLPWDFSMSPLKAWFNCWVEPETAAAVHCLGNAAKFFHLDIGDGPPWVKDPLDAAVAGLVCDLPLLARQMDFAGQHHPDLRSDLSRLAAVTKQEAARLLGIYEPYWERLWLQLCSGRIGVETQHRLAGGLCSKPEPAC
jgi:hypothetical protein